MLETAYQELQRARASIQQGQFSVGLEQLEQLLNSVADLRGDPAVRVQALIWGDMAQAHFFSGNLERAQQCNQNAYELCLALNDLEGVENYEQNLYELLRYQDQRASARVCAERMALRLQRQGRALEAREWKRKAARVETEPSLRVLAVVEGERFELDSLPERQNARVQFVFERNRITLPPAQWECDRARKLGSAGKYQEAEVHLRAARLLDRFDPESRMLSGLVQLDQGRWHQAVDQLEEAEQLAPGYFHVRSDLWFARRLASGQLAREFWELWRLLEDGDLKPQEKLPLCESVLKIKPNQAGVLLHYGRTLDALGRSDEAEQALLEGLRHAREPHLRTRLLLSLGAFHQGYRRFLREAVSLNGDLVSAAMARWLLVNSP